MTITVNTPDVPYGDVLCEDCGGITQVVGNGFYHPHTFCSESPDGSIELYVCPSSSKRILNYRSAATVIDCGHD